jgi:hypothetical protein
MSLKCPPVHRSSKNIALHRARPQLYLGGVDYKRNRHLAGIESAQSAIETVVDGWLPHLEFGV